MMAKCLVELRSGTRYRGVYESRDSFFPVINPPPPSLLSCSLKGWFLQRSETGCFSSRFPDQAGVKPAGRQTARSLTGYLCRHSSAFTPPLPPSTARFKGVEAGTRPGERRRRPSSQKSSLFALVSPARSVAPLQRQQFTLHLQHQD